LRAPLDGGVARGAYLDRMRARRALWALMLATVPAGGCISGDYGAVLLHLDARSLDASLPATYSSSTAGVGPSDGQLIFSAASSEGLVRVVLAGPLQPGDTITLPTDEERVQFQSAAGDWGNAGGTVYVISVDPAIIGLVGVPMAARSGAAAGSFVFDGNGTFRCADRDDACVAQ
jgi:hypothetical protein